MASKPLTDEQKFSLEHLIDTHGIAGVLDAIAEICNGKATHISEGWQDHRLARDWEHVARVASKTADFADAL